MTSNALPGTFAPLGPTYAKNGFHYELVVRDGDVAIYKQRLRPGVGCLAYEVIRIKVTKEAVMFGRVIPAHEVAPGNEMWGALGWTYPDLARAKTKMRELVARPVVARGVSKGTPPSPAVA